MPPSWPGIMGRNSKTASDDSPQPANEKSQFGLMELVAGISPDVDIVAIHGINGDRERSWTADNGVLWLRDLLPQKIPNARILSYGYDANTHGQDKLATEYMHDHATTFISKLALHRAETSTNERAIIFVAHSSGGILLKSALIHSHLSHAGHLKHHYAISHSTGGIAFFSTPHQGSETAELARFHLDIASPSMLTSNVLLHHLERDSEPLQQQLAQYSAISAQYETKFFYELYDTPAAGGISKRVVSKSDAVVPGAVNVEWIGINKDHINMVRYQSADDEDFKTVSGVLSLMAKAAHEKMIGKRGCHKSTEEIRLSASQQTALSNLPRVKAARYNADSRPRCLEGTRVDLLKTVIEWTEEEISRAHRQIFWLCGQAGTGKTTISLTVAGDCQEKGRLGASFFFSRDSTERSDIHLVFPTLAHQLGVFHRPFQMHLAKALDRDPDLVYTKPENQFKELIVEPLKCCHSFPGSTIVVIDALDECKDEKPISRILSILSSFIHELPFLKFFITSRPEDHIRGGFSRLSTMTQTIILHNIETSIVDADIKHYLIAEFTSGRALYSHLLEPSWPSDEAIRSLVNKSGGLFIFAATAMNFIFDRTYSHPPNQLTILLSQSSAATPPGSSPFAFLDRLYLQVLRQAFPKETPYDRLVLLRVIIGTIVLLRDPLSPGALERLLNLERGIVRTTLRHLHSLLVVPETDEDSIRLIHPSFFDFATSSCSDADFRIDYLGCHEQLAIACFKQMKALKRNICEIPDASKLNHEIEDLADRIKRHIPPAMQYACLHWPLHLRDAGRSTLLGVLREFCCGKILYWIEALSLLGCIREGIHQLQDVSKFLNIFSPHSQDLLKAISDSSLFMAEFLELISCATLQLYRSALPLSAPESSFLRKTFHHELNGGMRVLQRGGWKQRSSGLTRLRGSNRRIESAYFSLDGAFVVSASGDEVRLWDSITGVSLHELNAEPHSVVKWARIFPDGNRVIAGTTTSTISMWNLATGASLQTIQLKGVDPNKKFDCSAISPDLTHIAGSLDCYIYIWCASTGDLLKILSGHSKKVFCVAFSLDRAQIASASTDQTILIWNTASGAILRRWPTLSGDKGLVYPIAFSSDMKYFVFSRPLDYDLRLCDTNRGSSLKLLQGHTQFIFSIAFSPDGTRIISGSFDNSLRVWDAISGELLNISNYPGFGRNVGFSPDGTQYTSIVKDTVYIWDADLTSNLDQPTGREWQPSPFRFLPSVNDITYLTFSPDGTRIISTLSRTVQILDAASGNILFTIQADTIPIHPPKFSEDGSQVIYDIDRRSIIRYDIPPDSRPHSRDKPFNRLRYSIKGEWIFASEKSGGKEERCVWIPQDWRIRKTAQSSEASSSCGRVAIRVGICADLVLLDLSGIRLSI